VDLGVWFQRFQSNELIALSQFGQMTFTGLPAFLAGTGSFLYDPTPTPLSWRSLFGAWYAEDVIRLRPNLTLSLGSGMNSALGGTKRMGEPQTTRTQAMSSQRNRTLEIRCSPSIAPNSCPSQESAWRGAPSAARPLFAQDLACTTIFKTRWAIGPTRMPRSIRPIRLPLAQLLNLKLPINPAVAARVECPAGSRRSSTGHVHTNRRNVFSAN